MVGSAVGAVAEHLADRQPASPVGDDFGVIGQQCGCHGRGMRRHAGAEIESHAVKMIAAAGRTIRSALLEAVDLRIAIVPAARTLGEVAAERREMTDLRRGETLRGRDQARIGLRDAGVGRDRGDRGEGADARGAVRAPVYSDGAGCRGNIDQLSPSKVRCAAVRIDQCRRRGIRKAVRRRSWMRTVMRRPSL